MPDRSSLRATRSGMFFESDVRSAAETAAFEMEEHGLDADSVTELAERIGNLIRDFFREAEDA